jgi:hypothetical protein
MPLNHDKLFHALFSLVDLDNHTARQNGTLFNISGKSWIDELSPKRRVNCIGRSALKNMKMPRIENPTFPTRLFHTRRIPDYNAQKSSVDKLELLLYHRFSIQVGLFIADSQNSK